MYSHCYILYSETLQKFYVGASHEAIGQRVEKHNQHSYGKHRFTAAANDQDLPSKKQLEPAEIYTAKVKPMLNIPEFYWPPKKYMVQGEEGSLLRRCESLRRQQGGHALPNETRASGNLGLSFSAGPN